MVTGRRRAKVPRTPPDPLPAIAESELAQVDNPLWRVHRTSGEHVLLWNQLRTYGPLNSRFDPHPEPAGEHTPVGVIYVALDPPTALVEAFASTRRIDTKHASPYLTGWTPTRPLTLLDFTRGEWLLRAGASAALTAGPLPVCRAWARAIHAHAVCDGLLYPSTLTGLPCAVLWERAADSFPPRPLLSRSLTEPLINDIVAATAQRCGFGLY